MKRSEINGIQKGALKFFERHNFHLPPWSKWRPDDWKRAGEAAAEIKKRMLGWDVTDFGKGDFSSEGLVLFTLRNGLLESSGEPYCEKIMICRLGQRMPAHFHWTKTEDIINRAGGKMVMTLHNSDESEKPSPHPIKVRIDGIYREVSPGEEVILHPGESITLTPGLYHSLHARGEDILIGEVSSVNDDKTDNRFREELPRFPEIEEDEETLYCLCNEYPFFRQGASAP